MKVRTLILLNLMIFNLLSCSSKKEGKHLFILSGQSNMVRLLPEESFIPILNARFGEDQVIVVKDAMGSQPIRRWYKDWHSPKGEVLESQADLYDSLSNKFKPVISKEQIATITFVWMQGERDAREKHGEVYEESLNGLYNQICSDLERDDVNFIIGRLSDFDMKNRKFLHWTMIRDIQEKVGESNPRFSWINTDDLNDGFNRKGEEIHNDLHMSANGYVVMGERFANRAIQLIEINNQID